MINKKIIGYLKVILILFVGLWGQQVMAATCSDESGGNWSPSGTLTYQRDQAIGTWGSNKFGTPNGYVFKCTGDLAQDRDATIKLTVAAAPIAGTTDVYPTSMVGVGVRYNFNGGGTLPCPVAYDDHIANSTKSYVCHLIHATTESFSFGASVEFVKMQEHISSGVITSIPTVSVSYTLNNQSGTFDLPVMWNGNANVNVNSVNCDVTTTSIQVPLDSVFVSELTAVGNSAKPRTFGVGLNCEPNARVNVMLTGTQNSDTSVDGVLQLTHAGSPGVASGIGIQILYKNTPLVLNNNLFLKASSGGIETFPFTAQYYQTKATPVEGEANATATLEITYQ